MNRKICIIIAIIIYGLSACTKLDIPPMNIVSDKDVFTPGGIQNYMAGMYSKLPIEDFKYSPARGFDHFWTISPFPAVTGEALSRDQNGVTVDPTGAIDNRPQLLPWPLCYGLIRDANYFMQTLPKYANNFTQAQITNWMGEAHFIRATAYFALVKRYGGVPIVNTVLNYPDQSIDELRIPRASEQAVYDSIAADLDYAIANMDATSVSGRGRGNKYVAAGFKSRAMLFAGSIAKYNQISFFDSKNVRLCGITATKANDYFKASYDAAKLLEGKYSLYKVAWAAGDKQAQYKNFINLFFDKGSSENVFIRGYLYPQAVHGYDAYNVPRQLMGPNGYSSETCPTLDFVEMFEGFPKNIDGTTKTVDGAGHYMLYNQTMDFFANAEPRLRATVILPGDEFKGQNIEIRRGIYTGDVTTTAAPFWNPNSTALYTSPNLVLSQNAGGQIIYTLPNGTKMNAAGVSGCFNDEGTSSLTGFSIRKYLNPDMATPDVRENASAQTWIEMRYAEILLNRAEAAAELDAAGQGGTYHQDAINYINLIRDRAGASVYNGGGKLIDTIRQERRKELGFENKIWWDMRRWRTADKEQNQRVYKVLMPFYSSLAGKYFFDARLSERGTRYTFDIKQYYYEIPASEISKSPNLIQNPGF